MKEDPVGRPRGRQGATADLMRLVYLSKARDAITTEALGNIETSSQSNNLAAGITGLLIVQGGHFYGIMEGPRKRILQRMEVIITDARHSGLRILREEAIEARRFANWSFGRLPDEPQRRLGTTQPGSFIFDLSRRLA